MTNSPLYFSIIHLVYSDYNILLDLIELIQCLLNLLQAINRIIRGMNLNKRADTPIANMSYHNWIR